MIIKAVKKPIEIEAIEFTGWNWADCYQFMKVAHEKTDDFSCQMNHGMSGQELKAFLWKIVSC